MLSCYFLSSIFLISEIIFLLSSSFSFLFIKFLIFVKLFRSIFPHAALLFFKFLSLERNLVFIRIIKDKFNFSNLREIEKFKPSFLDL